MFSDDEYMDVTRFNYINVLLKYSCGYRMSICYSITVFRIYCRGFLFEKSFYNFSRKFRYYLLSFSCVTFLLNALFLINVYLFFVGVIVAPLNALYFVHECEELNSEIMKTKV